MANVRNNMKNKAIFCRHTFIFAVTASHAVYRLKQKKQLKMAKNTKDSLNNKHLSLPKRPDPINK